MSKDHEVAQIRRKKPFRIIQYILDERKGLKFNVLYLSCITYYNVDVLLLLGFAPSYCNFLHYFL